jgi:hypothetical protein
MLCYYKAHDRSDVLIGSRKLNGSSKLLKPEVGKELAEDLVGKRVRNRPDTACARTYR